MIEKYFEYYNEIYNDLKSMFAELNYRKEELYTISGQSFNDIKVTEKKIVGLDFYIAPITDLENKIASKMKEQNSIYQEKLNSINQLSKKEDRNIIRWYYLDKMSISQIASILYISERHVLRKKKQAIVNFEKIIKKI